MPIIETDMKCPHCGGIINDLDGLLQCLDYLPGKNGRAGDGKGCGTFLPIDRDDEPQNWVVQDWHKGYRRRKWLRRKLVAYVRYNLLTAPVLFPMALAYNYFWIGFTPVQLLKWLLTSAVYSAVANLVLQPWITFIHKRGWVK